MHGPLADLRVLEHTGTLAGSFAGWLLAELGATVVRADRAPEAWQPGERVLHRRKHVLRPDEPAWHTALRDERADVVLTDEHAAPSANPTAIRTMVSAWGSRAPRPVLPPDEALVAAATGIHGAQWAWSKRPVWMVTPMVSYMTGMLAALGTVAAQYARLRGAPPQEVHVSGLQGAFALNAGTYVTGSRHTGSLLDFGEPRGVYPTYALYQTADGWVFVGALTDAFWVKLATVLERVDLLADPRLEGGPLTMGIPDVRAFVRRELEPLFRARTTADWVTILRDADIPCGAVGSYADILADPEAQALGLSLAVDDPVLGPTRQPPPPATFSATPVDDRIAVRPVDSAATARMLASWTTAPSAYRPTGAPLVAGDEPQPAPTSPHPARTPTAPCFAGLRVLDVTSFIAGPVCPMLLADLGADVIKIESPSGDPFRYAAFAFVGWNRGKRSIVLDLHTAEGQAVFRDLVRSADVLVDNVRAGVLNRLGIGWDALQPLNPRLIHLSITGFGSTGPFTHLPGFDPVFQSRSGQMKAQGGSDEPVFHTIAYNDYCAGTLGALAVASALVARERTGRGQRVDVSLFRTALVDQAMAMIAHEGAAPPLVGGRDFLGPSAATRLYACRDGWICLAARTGAERDALGIVVGRPVAADDAPDGDAADAVVAWCLARTMHDALGHLSGAGVPAAPCLRFDDLWTDPLLRDSHLIIDTTDPDLDDVRQPNVYVTFQRTPAVVPRSAPRLGGHGPEILAEIGYPPDRIDALLARRVLGRPR